MNNKVDHAADSLLNFLNKLVEAKTPDDLAELLHVSKDDIVKATQPVIPATPAERHAMFTGYFKTMRRNMRQSGQHAREVLEELRDREVCEHPKHRLKPEGGKDWQPVDHQMAVCFDGLRESNAKMLKIWQLIADFAMQKAGLSLSPMTVSALTNGIHVAAVYDAILKSHFDMVRYGRDDFADFHIDRIVGVVESHAAKRVKELSEALAQHENQDPESGKTD